MGFMQPVRSSCQTAAFRWVRVADLFPLTLLVLMASPAAAGTFTPPEGCTGTFTVQMLGCTVSNHYICAGDPPGHKWRTDFAQNGAVFRSRIDDEAQWIESFDLNPDMRDVLEPGAADPASFTGLLGTGGDTFDFTTLSDAGVRERIAGYDRLTGEVVVVDGVTLKRTEFDAHATREDGSTIWHSKGNEYIHPEWRLFISGRGQWDGGDGSGFLPYDSSPISFAFPGEPGFFSTTPLFECDSTLSQADGVIRVRD